MWTVEDHLAGKSHAVRVLFERFEKLIRKCGPYNAPSPRLRSPTKDRFEASPGYAKTAALDWLP
jgi:hypothetical protein